MSTVGLIVDLCSAEGGREGMRKAAMGRAHPCLIARPEGEPRADGALKAVLYVVSLFAGGAR